MSEIKPNADGTCSRECPQRIEHDVYAECAALRDGITEDGEEAFLVVAGPMDYIGICPIAYQWLREAAGALIDFVESDHFCALDESLREGCGDSGNCLACRMSGAYDAVRDLVEVEDE